MTDVTSAYARLAEIRAELEPMEARAKALREEAAQLAVKLLRAEEQPGKVADAAPFSDTHVRVLARKAGIPPARMSGGAAKSGGSSS